MSFENASITWGANQLAAMVKNERIVFTNIVQRSYVWERSRKSGLIESMVIGVPIPTTYAKRYDDGSGKRNSNVYDMLDGKQRLSTIKQFINNEFALTALRPVTYYNELTNEEETFDMSGLTFDELPEGLQEKIKNARISVVYFDNLTKEEERELFKRLNAGKPLTAKSKTLASSKDIEKLLDIGSHKLFEEMISEKGRENKNQATIVMKAWCMLNMSMNDVSFETKVFNPLIEETTITEAEKLVLIQVFDFIFDVHFNLMEREEKKIAKKLYTETHLISLMPYFKKSLENGVSEEMMADWIVDFFGSENGATISDAYNVACGGGNAKNGNIVTRNNELDESYKSFFKMDIEEVDEEDIEVPEESTMSLTESIMADMDNVED